ncbi:hypothetical protein VSU01S_21340 [Vibrio superstes NBRC 103154]|uniref:Tyr recombinase domain-containing protein n=1 Tax=Vibrio superstes NBRC 103154 TaxID=1219062 RepID=A0A511QRB7_9VIBR|nr:hypothetical protein VSU01S_21340 [Vibrio superstes NBRC 103154]
MELLENVPENQEKLRQLNQVFTKERIPPNKMYLLDLSLTPSLAVVNEIYAGGLAPSQFVKNMMKQISFIDGTSPAPEAMDLLMMKFTNLLDLRLDARRAFESLDFPLIKKIHNQLSQLSESTQYLDNECFDHSYTEPIDVKSRQDEASQQCPTSSSQPFSQPQTSATVSHSNAEADPMPAPSCPRHWHIQTVLEAQKKEKEQLLVVNSNRSELPPEGDRAQRRCLVVHEVLGTDDVRNISRDQAIRAAAIITTLPVDPLKTRHKALFEGRSRTEWPEINVSLDSPLPTLKQKTVSDYIGSISTLYAWASKHYDKKHIQNPWVGIVKKRPQGQKEVDDRLPMDETDLAMVFGHRVFSKGQLGVNPRTKTPCAYQYWLPLLSLYDMLRGNEGAQLYRDDIKTECSIPYIEVRAGRELQSVKNPQSIRKLPIHARLIELGFIDYVSLFEPNERIFPELSYHQKDKYFRGAGDWFSRTFSKKYQESPELKSFYSLRHNCLGFYKDNIGINQPLIKALAGHINADITFERYGKEVALKMLKEQLDALHFPCVPEHITPFFEGNYLQYHKEHREKYLAMQSKK